ncbi:MAG TPA: hypothetical protein DET40_16715 [Lentisphaeria bacterium]|nr:MAG: hypothetical protein A2X45_13030 [Lentisphaerae bacterium GWF2_50_93]HCE45183.1 hypothetical protein [Lentisphaeria bacterium]
MELAVIGGYDGCKSFYRLQRMSKQPDSAAWPTGEFPSGQGPLGDGGGIWAAFGGMPTVLVSVARNDVLPVRVSCKISRGIERQGVSVSGRQKMVKSRLAA